MVVRVVKLQIPVCPDCGTSEHVIEVEPGNWVCMNCGRVLEPNTPEEKVAFMVPEVVDREAERTLRDLKARMVSLVKDHIHFGMELLRIRNTPELYRARGYSSFYRFLEEEAGIPRSTASNHIRAAQKISFLPEGIQEPLKEIPWGKLKKLLSLPPEALKEWLPQSQEEAELKAQKIKAQTAEEFMRELRKMRQRYINEITVLKNEIEKREKELRAKESELSRLKESVKEKKGESRAEGESLAEEVHKLRKKLQEIEKGEASYQYVLRRWRTGMDRILDTLDELTGYEVPLEIVPDVYQFFERFNKKIQTLHRKLEELHGR